MSVLKYSRSALIATTLTLGLVLSPTFSLTAAACQAPLAMTATEGTIPLFDNLGDHHYAISTNSDLAQQYFNQGLILAYGFNHAEAARSFQAATQADADCALCYWGLAYVQGPNINAPMEDAAVPTAWDAIQQAIAKSRHATIKERLLIQALADRYSPEATADRAALDLAYAKALKTVHQRYPDDLDIATLYAEALMDTMPWDYWDEQGNAKPETVELLHTLETVLAQNPHHIGALHLYIHAVEKEHPELAEEVADRLRGSVPGSGHLVHMPSHIYIRVGRYHDAVAVNQDAIEADDAYLQSGQHVPSIYTIAYMPHNHHFEWFGALMTGQQQIAMQAAEATGQVDEALMRDPAWAGSLQHYHAIPLFTQVRFERWDDILASPQPASDLKYVTGIWHYARGMALAATGKPTQAQSELAAVNALMADPDLSELRIWGFNGTTDVLNIAAEVLSGEIAAAQANYDTAVTHLQTAIELEDQLVYTEPPDWYSPTHNLLGQILLEAQRYGEAESTFRADLALYPANGWSLQGLAQSLEAQGKTVEAAAVRAQFEEAWQYADADVLASR